MSTSVQQRVGTRCGQNDLVRGTFILLASACRRSGWCLEGSNLFKAMMPHDHRRFWRHGGCFKPTNERRPNEFYGIVSYWLRSYGLMQHHHSYQRGIHRANEIISFRRCNERFPFADDVGRKLRCPAGTNIPG